MQSITLTFNINDKPQKWNIVHNLDDFGLSIESALQNWGARTKRYTINSFCDYVVSKDKINLMCMPKSKYDMLINKKIATLK